MKLRYRIISRVFITLSIILSIWATFFYFIIIGELYDEIDDNLEDYSEIIITNFNAGNDMPHKNNGTNNSYHIELISKSDYIMEGEPTFLKSMLYIEAKQESEPVRIFKTTFRGDGNKTYRLIVYTPSIEHEDLIESILLYMVYLFILLLVTIGFINIWVYKTSMAPMYKILSWLETYQLGEKNKKLYNKTDISEFQKLNDAINSNIERIEKNYTMQKEFIANASHELQTPLAICKTRLEGLLDSDLKEEQLGKIIKTQNTIDYMTRLNKTLLLLSKIENQQFIDKEEVNISYIIDTLICDFKEIYASHKIDVVIQHDAILTVNMNHVLAKTLVINLLKNAFVHNHKFGMVHINIEYSKLVIENSGDSALDDKLIFEHFYQGTKKENCTGLGLAIAHSICKENNYKITYKYIQQKHQFSILF